MLASKPELHGPSLHQYTMELYDGQQMPLASLAGKVCLIVNIASRCGFTPQLGSLEDLYQSYKDRGLVILGFPGTKFLEPEPLNDSEFMSFCRDKYNITFPIARKAAVAGSDKQPVYQFLTEQSGEAFRGDPGWNFVKFLVDPDGHVTGRYSSVTRPKAAKIKRKIELYLS